MLLYALLYYFASQWIHIMSIILQSIFNSTQETTL